jgi:FkbM family methyltransferase
VVSVRLPNDAQLKLWSRGDDWISTQIFWRGIVGYEPETVPLFFRLAEQAAITLDVGAYVGYFTVIAALANPDGRVIALEPAAKTFDRLLGNVRLNGLSNVECRNVAAGALPGRADLHHMSGAMSMAASLDPRHLAPWEHVSTSVAVVALDDLVTELEVARVDLMKIDAEATEAAVLEGAAQILNRNHPHIICEVLSAESGTRLTAILEPLGYRFYELCIEGPRERADLSLGRSWNYLCTTASLAELPLGEH